MNESHGGFSEQDLLPLDVLRRSAFNQRWAEQPESVIPLTAADADFRVAPVIRERLARHACEGAMGYGPPHGLPEFRVVGVLGVVVVGGVGVGFGWVSTRGIRGGAYCGGPTHRPASAMAVAARASLRPGDEALVPDPVDFLFQHTVRRVGATAVPVALSHATTAEAFIAAMQARLTPRTRMLWLCNPHNPLGLVHGADWLGKVVHWAIERRLRVLSDEVWSDVVFPPHRHVSPASLSPEAARQVVTVYGFSKNFGLAGLRIGCLVCADPDWFRQIVEASDAESTVFGAATASQVAATAALQEGRPWLQGFVAHLQRQRDHAVARLRRWPGVGVRAPQGTFVVFPDVSRLVPAGVEAWCGEMKAQAGVALVPGAARWFGHGAAGHVRLSFATSRDILETAFDRMDAWIAARSPSAAA